MSETLFREQINVLETNQEAWINYAKTSTLDDYTSVGAPGITKALLTRAFSIIIKRLKELDLNENPYLSNVLTTNLPSWTSPIAGWIQSLNASPSLVSNIFSHLNAIASQFNAYESFSEKEVSSKSVARLATEQNKLLDQIKNLRTELEDLLSKRDLLNQALVEVKNIDSIKASLEADASVAGAHRATIESDSVTASELLASLKESADSIPEFEKKRNEITDKCEEILDEAKERLDAASRAGMATSFAKRAAEYEEPREGWFFLFLMSLAGILIVGAFFIFPEIKGKEGSERLYQFVTEIPLTLPFVWLAWFSALRFSQLGRLREDYEYKVATALSLDGYLKQTDDVSQELKVKLLDIAITNFGENPLRLMTKETAKDAHPLAGVFDEKVWSQILKSGIQSIADKTK